MAAALLHVVNHAAFKTLLFLGAGSVSARPGLVTWTGSAASRGGCRPPPPFAVAALARRRAAAARGFVSEWLLLQGLIHGLPVGDVLVAVDDAARGRRGRVDRRAARRTFVKALGTGFLARPRSDGAAEAAEASPAMLAGDGVAAAAVRGSRRLAPASCCSPLARCGARLARLHDGAPCRRAAARTLCLAGISGSVSPVLLAVAVWWSSVLAAVAAAGCGRRGGAAPGRGDWGCGRASDGPDGVHRDGVRRAAAAGLRRRAAPRHRRGRQPHRASRVTSSTRSATAPGSATGSSTGSTGRCSRRSARGAGGPAACTPAASTATSAYGLRGRCW